MFKEGIIEILQMVPVCIIVGVIIGIGVKVIKCKKQKEKEE